MVLAFTSSCKDATPPLVATTVTPSVTSVSFDAIGATQAISATVRDQNGAVMTNVTPSYTSAGITVATVSGGASATVTAVADGSTSITVLAGSVSASIGVTVSQAPVAPVKVAGDGQSATVGAALATPLKVKVQDRLGNAMTGRTVLFTPGAGSGTVSATSTTSASDGTATVTWTVGTVPGAQTLTANTSGVTDAATFTATANVGAPAAVAVSAGNSQTAIAGAAVSTALAVRVADAFNNPVPGVSVSFGATAGSGSITGSPATTSAQGVATAGTWTLGTLVGTKTVTATVTGLTALSFTASAIVGPAAIMTVNAGNNQTATAGQAIVTKPSVKVTDANTNVVQGTTVTFAVASGGGSATGTSATTNSSGIATVGGWTLGGTPGTNTMTASATGLGTLTFTVTGAAPTAASVTAVSGNGQSATVSTAVATAPSVRVSDISGNPVSGVGVTFAVASGGGSASGTSTSTNSSGLATLGSWTLGPTAGSNTLTATVSGSGISGNPVTFTATGTAVAGSTCGPTGLCIELRYLTSGSASQVAAFTAAAARWQSIITAKLPNGLLNAADSTCGSNSPPISEVIDDVVILVTFAAIDGVGGVLGSAGPCYIRNSSKLPILGQMRFDVADLANMEANGTLNSVILHEMGHVLGIGTLWDFFPGLLLEPSWPSSSGVDTRFTGENAIAGFNAIGGTTYTLGGKVPVENTQGGEGTRDSHWRESVLLNELMTGFIGGSNNPMSQLTVRSLQDIGYTVDVAQADAFFLTLTAASLREPGGVVVELKDDVSKVPIKVVDEQGRVLRVLSRRRAP